VTKERAEVVTCFLLKNSPDEGERLLLLRRSDKVGSYRGRWGGISGYREGDALDDAYREIEEEVGLTAEDVELVRGGPTLPVDDPEGGQLWLVHPFLFNALNSEKIRLDWEHSEMRWVAVQDLHAYETVPQLAETLASVYTPT
jgi:8-oxo-dGTP pyrophosphatase MutT (NUDIX family)